MYDLLSQIHPTLCTLVLTIRLRVVIHEELASGLSFFFYKKNFLLDSL